MMEPIRLLIADDHQMVRDGLRRILEREPDLAVVGESGGVSDTFAEIQRLRPDVLLLDLHLTDGTGRDVLPLLVQAPHPTRAIILTGHEEEGTAEEMIGLGASGFLLKNASARELIAAIRAVARGEIWADHATLSRLVAHLRVGSFAPDGSGPARAGDTAPPIDEEHPTRRERRGFRLPSSDAGPGNDTAVLRAESEEARVELSRTARGAEAAARDKENNLRRSRILSEREREILQSVGLGFNNSEIAARLYISENTVKAHLSRIFQKLMVADRTQAVIVGLQHGLIRPAETP
jgi:two-component system response regulator DegU